MSIVAPGRPPSNLSGSLVQATDNFLTNKAALNHRQRACAKMILEALEKNFPPSTSRDAVRQEILKKLVWFETEIATLWLKSQFISETTGE